MSIVGVGVGEGEAASLGAPEGVAVTVSVAGGDGSWPADPVQADISSAEPMMATVL